MRLRTYVNLSSTAYGPRANRLAIETPLWYVTGLCAMLSKVLSPGKAAENAAGVSCLAPPGNIRREKSVES